MTNSGHSERHRFMDRFRSMHEPSILGLGFSKLPDDGYMLKKGSIVVGFDIQHKTDMTSCCINYYVDYLFFVDVWGQRRTIDGEYDPREFHILSGRPLLGRQTCWWKYCRQNLNILKRREGCVAYSCDLFTKNLHRSISRDLLAMFDCEKTFSSVTDKYVRLNLTHKALGIFRFGIAEHGVAFFLAQLHNYLGNTLKTEKYKQLCEEIIDKSNMLSKANKKLIQSRLQEL